MIFSKIKPVIVFFCQVIQLKFDFYLTFFFLQPLEVKGFAYRTLRACPQEYGYNNVIAIW